MIYKLILTLRNKRYSSGTRSKTAAVPTVCVGNISVGGTGKTPHTEMILRELLASERWGAKTIAVLSRGYKRKSKGFQLLPADASARLYGDEPSQIKRKFPAITVAVDKDRVEGCDLLAHPEAAPGSTGTGDVSKAPGTAADIIVLDDAYQYRKLKPALSIVLTRFIRPVTTDRLLPLGRLRDLKERLYDSDIVIVSYCPADLLPEEKAAHAKTLGYDSYDPATCEAEHKGRRQLLCFTHMSYGELHPLFPESDVRYSYSHKAIILSGIANDEPLCKHVSESYKIVGHLSFPDHHRFGTTDIKAIIKKVKRSPTALIITTEKDAQRLKDLKTLPAELKRRIFCQPIQAEFLSGQERTEFINKLITL